MDGIQVGLSNLHYAIMTSDETTGVIYQAPVQIAGAINAKISPKVNSETLYADDGPAETASGLGEISVELEVKDLTFDAQAALLGHTITGGVMVKKSTDTAPYVAIGFKSQKSNGKYRYKWLLKGKFEPAEAEHATKEDKPKFQTPKIKATFVKRAYDNAWEKSTDEDHADYVAATGTNWFTTVEAAADTTAPTVTTVPLDAAAGVAVSANVVWTFNEAIMASTVTDANFFLMKADGTAVPGALTISADKTVVTLDPTSNMTAATAHIAVATQNVKNLAGIPLAATSVTNFTTA